MLSRLTKVVESQMCSGEWDEIEYSHVPSVAMKNYRKAFARHSPDRWDNYLSAIERGDPDVKINASSIFPHDIILGWVTGSYYEDYENPAAPDRQTVRAAEAQWNALPDYMGENSGKILAMADVSGSMLGGYGSTLSPMDVSVSLALYVSERARGPFQDVFMTFSRAPNFVQVRGANLYEKVANISRADWSQNTNLQAAFDSILEQALRHEVSQEDMPETLLIISDMQFDRACSRHTNYEVIRAKYAAAGYIMPNIVFWNVRAAGDSPVKMTNEGVALISGFNPSVLTALLGGEMSPMAVLNRAINSGRYDAVTI